MRSSVRLGAICERDSSGTTRDRSEATVRVMERIARREGVKRPKRLAQICPNR
jgi:hypothetical protein